MKKVRDSVWTDLTKDWDHEGPDPRWNIKGITVRWSNVQQPIDQDGMMYEDEQSYSAKNLADAQKKYRTCLSDPAIKHCDVMLELSFGGLYRRLTEKTVGIPHMNGTYIYLVRWRADGAYLETYHINSSKFGERGAERNELTKTGNQPGLMEHYRKEKKQKVDEQEAK